jgi:NTP pyrophosphatase (non-canonical NTP hydrolase)
MTKYKTIALPRLNNLTPTIESTTLKLMEEVGEFSQVVGKFRGLSGENETYEKHEITKKMVEELLDVAQVAISLMFVLEDEYGISIDDSVDKHIEKLKLKKYIK